MSDELTEADIAEIMAARQKPDVTVALFQAVARIKAEARREALLEYAAAADKQDPDQLCYWQDVAADVRGWVGAGL